MPAIRTLTLATAGLLALSGCAAPPMGPMVQVMPPPDKPFGVFQEDQAVCGSYANGVVAGQVQAANNGAVGGAVLGTVLGTALGAAVGGGRGAAVGAATGIGLGVGLGASSSGAQQYGIQARYDGAYAQCMYSRGNQVPGFAPVVAYAPVGYGGTDLVRAVQVELNRLLYMKGFVDGVAGAQTVAAIRSFEAAQGLPQDGAPSDFLLDRLRRTPG